MFQITKQKAGLRRCYASGTLPSPFLTLLSNEVDIILCDADSSF